jgi:hypothetical protein
MAEDKKKTVAETIVHDAERHRFWTTLIGGVLSLALIGSGIWFTQQSFGSPSTGIASCGGDLSAKIGLFTFAAKNTAPGIILILCGTWLATTTINRRLRARTQWANDTHPGLTEVDG